MTKFVCNAVLTVAFTASIFGQDFRATILCQVTDASKSAIPAATIKARRAGTNETTEVKTNASGNYSIPYLQPGTYTIEVTAPGFSVLKREGITLQVADKLNLPLMLELGQVTQEVTVVGEQELVSSVSASRGLNFD